MSRGEQKNILSNNHEMSLTTSTVTTVLNVTNVAPFVSHRFGTSILFCAINLVTTHKTVPSIINTIEAIFFFKAHAAMAGF